MFSDLETQFGEDTKVSRGEGSSNLRVKYFPKREQLPRYTLFYFPSLNPEKAERGANSNLH